MALIVFVIILSILILTHEWGHFIMAKKCGIKVDQFSLGFGPKLFSRVHEGTEFCLCAIPLGGYVKMAGDEREHCSGAGDEFFAKSAGQRALVVVIGPVVNLALAYGCFWLVFLIGFVDMDASAKKIEPRIGQVLSGSAAEKAGLMTGDKVLAIDGITIAHWPDLQEYIVKSKTAQLAMTLERDGQVLTKIVVPQDQGQKDIFGREHNFRRVGIGSAQIKNVQDMIIVRYGFWGSFTRAGQELVNVSAKTYAALYEMLVGLRSPKEAMGVVGMFFVIKFALSVGFSFLLHIIGVISLGLAIFNLLPLIPLDGGHLLLFAVEKMRGKALPVKAELMIARGGFYLIVTLALFVFYADFERIGLIDNIRSIFLKS